MTTFPAGWWLVGGGVLPVAQGPVAPASVVVLVVAVAAALALDAARRAGRQAE